MENMNEYNQEWVQEMGLDPLEVKFTGNQPKIVQNRA